MATKNSLELNKIHNIDCLAGMGMLDCGMVDVIVTSPPYNIGIDYSKYEDSLPRENYLDWMENIAIASKKTLNDNGSFFLNIGNKPSDTWIAFDVASRFRKHYVLQNILYWVKSIAIERSSVGNYPGILTDIAVGHFKPIGGNRFLNDCMEYIFHFTKTGYVELDRLAIGVKYQDKSNIGRWKKATQDKRCRGNVWFIPYKTIKSRDDQRPHPATFPDLLPEMCIRLHGLSKTKMVMDPFMGIGSTALACQRLGVDYIGFEIDESYILEAERRISQKRLIYG